MARPLRIEYEGALYHITARGNERGRIFVNEADYVQFLERLRQSLQRYDIGLYAYVLMGNHYHLIAQTRRANLGRWMHWLSTAYTVYFNWAHRRVGHLFEGRYKAIVVDAQGYLLTLSRYLHLNPVRGRVLGQGTPKERRARLRAWRWSSYGAYSGLSKPEDWLEEKRIFSELGGTQRGVRVRYRRFVEEGILREIENPLDAVQWQSVLGRESFVQRVRDRVEEPVKEAREVPALRALETKKQIDSILTKVAKAYGCTKGGLLRAGVKGNEARAVAMVLAWDCCGITLVELTKVFGAPGYTAVAQMIRRTRMRDDLRFNLDELKNKCLK